MASADVTGTLTAPAPQVKIRPAARWPGLGLRDMAEYRELLYFLTKRELQIKYKQSVFGVGWVIMQPLVMTFVFAVFFGLVANIASPDLPYPVFYIVAVVPWLFTSQTVGMSAASLVGDANLLTKVYFPRLALPVAKALALLVDLAISLVLMFAVIAAYQVGIETTVLLVPAFLLLGALTAIGPGTLFAAVNVRYRDVTLIVPVLLSLWTFATPVIYPGSLVPDGLAQYAYSLNPMVTVIDGMRWAFFGAAGGPAPDPISVAISVTVAITTALVAVIYFRRTEQFFADVV
jgi:homopolymeric O-antigen transport system permease protein